MNGAISIPRIFHSNSFHFIFWIKRRKWLYQNLACCLMGARNGRENEIEINQALVCIRTEYGCFCCAAAVQDINHIFAQLIFCAWVRVRWVYNWLIRVKSKTQQPTAKKLRCMGAKHRTWKWNRTMTSIMGTESPRDLAHLTKWKCWRT